MKTIWHQIIPFRWCNLLPWRRCVWCSKVIWFCEWRDPWCWIRWGIPEHCSKECADAEIYDIANSYDRVVNAQVAGGKTP